MKFCLPERTELVFQLVFKTSSGWIKPTVAGSIPALSATLRLKSCFFGKILTLSSLSVGRDLVRYNQTAGHNIFPAFLELGCGRSQRCDSKF
jgi:hypothetical protein